jgi:hypothetical protein
MTIELLSTAGCQLALPQGHGFLALQPHSLGDIQGEPGRFQACVYLDIGEGDLIDVSQGIFGLNAYHTI